MKKGGIKKTCIRLIFLIVLFSLSPPVGLLQPLRTILPGREGLLSRSASRRLTFRLEERRLTITCVCTAPIQTHRSGMAAAMHRRRTA